jgi:hypothetical protein
MGGRPRGIAVDLPDEVVATPLVETRRLVLMREGDNQPAVADHSFALGREQQLPAETAATVLGLDPQALDLAATTPGPAAQACDEQVTVVRQDSKVHFVSKARSQYGVATNALGEHRGELRIGMWFDPQVHHGARQGVAMSCSVSPISSK